ncbi:MAG: iron-sulfur cluster assembly scaffold protein [Candidatus Jacksonbacteria bacterium]|jgi:nitrogen fixation protein NifU and related proteins|nr:iron-sulfur cluster assembly scaffold protein [Candidatus Jacksonbacteria bacterium]MBT6034263.1 iron-sulfur cluster assembly scaffold protein [Candidatus Jacksonbacteria bacterium]MBT6301327.1 iron-sulfur cluster assembly scaffold protein [Candidatus Jacksonbacteria bacterium]MBT6756969.1 iron-sulfur cluster assembly scaffold protein [Candidatus Jacksonbacteria bacterium]MBT6955256.1 iron-sulfur cluster assembly scaffold protein [Candidatus Jacksonbacteria bacterium]
MSMYREHILEHYKHPQNRGEISECTHHAHVSNPLCGDEIDVWINTHDLIKGIGFDGHGCAISIAAASLVTEWTKGKSAEEVLKLTQEDIVDMLGIEITPVRLKCALLVRDGVFNALRVK